MSTSPNKDGGADTVVSAPAAHLLDVEHLSVEFRSTERVVAAVRDVSFYVGRGETVAIVGESGSGKSVTALSLMRLVEHGGGTITAGRMDFARDDGTRIDLARASAQTMRSVRGAEMAMIFQEPMTSLNPVFTVGEQIAESIRLHQGADFSSANREALRMLEQVRIPEAAQVLSRYPHQLSGGMRQRVMTAMALLRSRAAGRGAAAGRDGRQRLAGTVSASCRQRSAKRALACRNFFSRDRSEHRSRPPRFQRVAFVPRIRRASAQGSRPEDA